MTHSIQVEKHSLGGLIRHPEVFADVDGFLTERDFFNQIHGTIYLVIRESLIKREKIDKVLLAQKIKNLGVAFKDDIDIFEYIETISFTQITPEATVKACQELVKLRIRRELIDTSKEINKFVEDSSDKAVSQIIAGCDGIYNKRLSLYEHNEKPVNIFKGLEDEIEELGNNPVEEMGFKTPYAEFNRLFGGLQPGEIYAIVSRPAEGKSSFLADLCFKTSQISKFKVKTLLLDTEMSTVDLKHRMAAALSGIPLWYIRTGNWRKNPDFLKRGRAAWAIMKDYEFNHMHVSNKSIDEICSIIRRWYYSEVGRGNPAVIAYDYIKLTGEKVGQNWAEYQAIGEKVNRLKEVITELHVPLVTAMQMNRTGNNFNKKRGDVTDDSTAIALSDRLQWFASFVAIFRRKTIDELILDGKFGTHKMIPLKTRFQGKDATGHTDMICRPMPDGSKEYVHNYLNYDVTNFNVEEKGSLWTIIQSQAEKYKLVDDKIPEHDGALL